MAAAIKIQAWWRGLTARRDFAPMWAAHCAARNERNAAIVLQTVGAASLQLVIPLAYDGCVCAVYSCAVPWPQVSQDA